MRIVRTVSFFLFPFSSALCALALPHYGDENQAYDKLSDAFVTPHVKWATPLAGGKVRALVVIPYNMAREAIELKERIDLDMTVIQTAGKLKRAQAYADGDTATPLRGTEAEIVVDRIMRERLVDAKAKYDVIVLARIGWDVFKAEEKQAIVDRVKAGTGLVWYGPTGKGADYEALVGSVDEAAREEVFRGYPADVFPIAFFKTTEEMKGSYRGVQRFGAKKAPCRVLSARLGKGRVISLDFDDPPGRQSAMVFGFDYRDPEAPKYGNSYDYTVFGYNFALAARAILAVTGRDARALTLEVAKQFPRSSAQELKVKVKGEGEQRSGRLLFELRPRRAPHGASAVYTAEVKVKGEGEQGNVSFKLPVLPAGTYLAAVRLRDEKDAAVDFATTAFEVTTDVSLKIETKSDRYEAGTTIEGTVTPSRPLKAGERIVVRATDTWGRLVAEVKVKGEGEQRKGDDAAVRLGPSPSPKSFTFSIPVDRPLCRLWDLQAAVVDEKGDVARAGTWVGIPDWTFDDYTTMLIFSCEPSANGWKGDYNADLMRRKAGLNAVFSGDLMHGDASVMENNERHHLQTIAYFGHFGEEMSGPFDKPNTTRDLQAVRELVEEYVQTGVKPLDPKTHPQGWHGMDVGAFNRQLRVLDTVGRFGTPHYSLTMENYLSGEFRGLENSGFAPRDTAAFRQWCRMEYGNDILKLNAEWNTSFASFDEVTGTMLVDAVLNNQTSRWVDFRYFMRSEVWGGFFLNVERYIHAVNPKFGYVGMGGHSQHDYTRYRGPHMTSGKLYVSQAEHWEWLHALECEMRQSFADDEGWWLGSHSSYRWATYLDNPIARQRNPWSMLFMGLRGFNYEDGLNVESLGGMSWTYADYSDILPYTADYAREVRTLQRGIGKLALAAKPVRAPVAIDWSPRNHYISRLLPAQPRGFTGTWMYNVALNGGAPDDALCLMNSLAMRPKIIAPEDVRDLSPIEQSNNRTVEQFCSALWLPYNKGMSEEEARDILAFVRAGGLVLADNEPGTYTQHGKKRENRLLKELFPDFSRVTVTPCGKGHAVYLAGKLNGYPDRMLAGDFAGSDGVEGWLRDLAGVEPAVRMRTADGKPVRNVRLTAFDIRGTRLVGLLRPHTSKDANDSITYTFDFGREYDVYDVTKGSAYLGRHAKMELALDHHAKMLALVPMKIVSAKLTATSAAPGGKIDLSLAVQTSNFKPQTSNLLADAWHLEVFGPDGRELECYRKNYVVEGNAFAETLPVALNAAKGTYRVVMTSAVSGVKAETTLEVR